MSKEELLRKRQWNEEDVALWLHAHLGEYIVKMAEIHKQASENESNLKSRGKTSARINESLRALSEILPKNIILKPSIVDCTRVVEDAEPEVQKIIPAISELLKKEPET